MKNQSITEAMLQFIEESPTAFHAAANVEALLLENGFEKLENLAEGALVPGGSYYTMQNGSAVLAVKIPENPAKGFRIAASHSDSPCFKIKEVPEMKVENTYVKLNVEKYGGMILSPWLDRPLSVAGRVFVAGKDGKPEVKLVNLKKDLLIIPNVAIHFNREINQGYKHNVHVDLQPLYGGSEAELMTLLREEAGCKGDEEIVDMDLILTVRQPAVAAGVKDEFLLTPRFDDLGCVYTTLQGFLRAQDKLPKEALSVFCLFDNEEVGSGSRQGALSNFLPDVLERICLSYGMTKEEQICARSRSFLLSADNAHAVHPNHPEKSDDEFPVVLNGGVVIKYNASQRYTTTGMTGGVFGSLCEKNDIKTQLFVNRADMPGGSTLGNLLSHSFSVPMVDIGLPQLAMHSAVETAGCEDVETMIEAIQAFYESEICQIKDGMWRI